MKDVLRTSKCLKKYRARRKILGEGISNFDFNQNPTIKTWFYWKLIKNQFPYDKIASQHDLLVPKRKFEKETDMLEIERNGLDYIKKSLGKNYDAFIINTEYNRTVSSHFHIHCIKYKYITPTSELS